MFHFDYLTPNIMEVLVWKVDENGFVDVEVVNLDV